MLIRWRLFFIKGAACERLTCPRVSGGEMCSGNGRLVLLYKI